MSAILQDCPPVQAAYEEFNRFRSDPVMQEKVRAREWFLNEQQLVLGGTYYEGKAKKTVKLPKL